MMKHVLPHMMEAKKGSIINVASVVGMRGLTDSHTYTATKGAILNLTRSAAITYGQYGIRVNSMAPGFEPNHPIIPPLGRAGKPIDIAYGCLYLASDEASYTSGTALVIDGALLARV